MLGINLGSVFYFNGEPIFVDLMKQGAGIYNADGSGLAPVDGNGFPTVDFGIGLQRLPPDAPPSQSVTVRVDGNPGTVTMPQANGWTLGATTYDSGTDTGTVTLTTPSVEITAQGCHLLFTGTKRTPASATNTGVRKIRVPRHGYEGRPDQNITDEFIAQMAPFKCIRFVKVMGAETRNDFTAWSNYPRRSGVHGQSYGGEESGIMPIEDIVDIANVCNCNVWVNHCGGGDQSLGTLSFAYGIAAYLEANLNPGLFIVHEDVNETWNLSGYQWFGYGNDAAMRELHGFWSDNFDRASVNLASAQRTSNVVTMSLNYAHGMGGDQTYSCQFQGRVGTGTVTAHPTDSTHFTIPDTGTDCKIAVTLGTHYFDSPFFDARIGGTRTSGVVTAHCRLNHGFTSGDSVYVPLNGLTSTTKIFTITVVDVKTFTFADAGADGGLAMTGDNNSTGGSLSTGSALTFDGDASGSAYMSEKYWTRHKVQMSDNIRLAVGDSLMMNRHRPVFMTQWASGTIYRFYDAKAMIESGLGTTYAAKFYAIGGAGYPDGTTSDSGYLKGDNSAAHAAAEYIAEFQDSTTIGMGANVFTPDLFKTFALSEGCHQYMYECGIDTKMYQANTGFYAANAAQLRAATLDPAWKQIERNFPEQQANLGTELANIFNAEMISQATVDGQGYWALTWGTLTRSPKQQAFIDWAASPPTATRNVVPGTVDARNPITFYETSNGVGGANFNYGGFSYPTMATPWSAYPQPFADRWQYIINSTQARSMSMTITYKTLAAVSHTITLLRNGSSIGTFSVPSVGVGNLGTTTPITVTMALGTQNAIALQRDSANSDFEIHSMTFS
jgi:hypothetical protein